MNCSHFTVVWWQSQYIYQCLLKGKIIKIFDKNHQSINGILQSKDFLKGKLHLFTFLRVSHEIFFKTFYFVLGYS